MQNSLCGSCGGCPLRGSDIASYREQKIKDFERIIKMIQPVADTFPTAGKES